MLKLILSLLAVTCEKSMIRDLTRWDRRKAVLFIIIAVVTSGFGVISHSDTPFGFGSETKYHQGLPFSFYRYSEHTSDQDVGGHRVFFAPGFILDMLVWYLIAHFAVRFYDNSKLIARARAQVRGYQNTARAQFLKQLKV